jgi:hypothetical protein
MALAVFAILAWDVYAILVGGTEATISQLIIELSYQYPAMTFALGYVMGHLTWRVRSNKAMQDAGIDKK